MNLTFSKKDDFKKILTKSKPQPKPKKPKQL